MMKSGENLYLIDFGMFKDGLNPEEARQYAAANMAYFILSESYNKKLPIPDKIKQKLEAYAKKLINQAKPGDRIQKNTRLFVVPYYLPKEDWAFVHPLKILCGVL